MDANNLKKNVLVAKTNNRDKDPDKFSKSNIYVKLASSKLNIAGNKTNEAQLSKESYIEHKKARNRKTDHIFKINEAEIKHPTTNRKQSIKEIKAEDSVLYKKLEKEPVKTLSLEERKRIRDKYTITMRNSNQNTVSNFDFAHKIGDTRKMDTKNDTVKLIASPNDYKYSGNKEVIKVDLAQHKDEIHIQRKPVIKTTTTKNDTMRYKAVTFIDQTRNHPTPLQINMPNEANSPKKAKITNFTDVYQMETKIKSTISKVSVKEKPVMNRKKKRDKKFRCVPSPDFSLRKNISPPTEVAKWAPSSINDLTKPYYEAWVDTTLAAISRNTKKDKLFFQKQNIIETFKSILEERPMSPELVYENYANEKYTGRIRINKR